MIRDFVIETWGDRLGCRTRMIDWDVETGEPLKTTYWLAVHPFGSTRFKTLGEAMLWCMPICKTYRRLSDMWRTK